MKTLQVGLGETLRKLSIIVSMSAQNLWFVSKLQNLSIRSLFRCLRLFNLCLVESNLVFF